MKHKVPINNGVIPDQSSDLESVKIRETIPTLDQLSNVSITVIEQNTSAEPQIVIDNKHVDRENLLKSLEKRVKTTRKHIIMSIVNAQTGHLGASLSAADIITALYFGKMRYDPEDPDWHDRDRFILCKGHAAPALYAVLAEAGFFPIEELSNLRKTGSLLQGHPDTTTPGVDIPTGSLGQGLSVANGIALAGKLDKKAYRVYALLGDGECDEGQVWEAVMTAAHYKLNNITAIIDCNNLQSDGTTDEINKKNLPEMWRSFGWNVLEIDGHNFEEILDALDTAEREKDRPTVIIAKTVKGKGISFMEENNHFHNKIPTLEELELALRELDCDNN